MAIASVEEVMNHYGYSREKAVQFLDTILNRALENRQGNKDHRPWQIVNFSELLDPDKAWIGFEFETGFDDVNEYKKFINFLWGQKYTAIDREGTGNYPVEVAFAPMHADDVLAGNSTLQAALRFIHDAKLTPALNPTTFTQRDVGCHAGISTPKYRALGVNSRREATYRLDACLQAPSEAQRKILYNRPKLLWGGASFRGGYVELKTFRAVPTLEAVEKYVRVTGQAVKLLDLLIDNPELKLTRNQAFEFLNSTNDEVY